MGSEEADSTRRATSHSKRNGNGAILAAIRSTSSLNSNEFHRKFTCGADKTLQLAHEDAEGMHGEINPRGEFVRETLPLPLYIVSAFPAEVSQRLVISEEVQVNGRGCEARRDERLF